MCPHAQAVWFSASADLAVDAKRDLVDVGAFKYDPIRIHDLRRVENIAPGRRLEDVQARMPACSRAPRNTLAHASICMRRSQ